MGGSLGGPGGCRRCCGILLNLDGGLAGSLSCWLFPGSTKRRRVEESELKYLRCAIREASVWAGSSIHSGQTSAVEAETTRKRERRDGCNRWQGAPQPCQLRWNNMPHAPFSPVWLAGTRPALGQACCGGPESSGGACAKSLQDTGDLFATSHPKFCVWLDPRNSYARHVCLDTLRTPRS